MNRRVNENELPNNLTEDIKIIEIDNIYDYFLKEYEKCDCQSDNKKIAYKCGILVYTGEMFEKKRKEYINKCRTLGVIKKSR